MTQPMQAKGAVLPFSGPVVEAADTVVGRVVVVDDDGAFREALCLALSDQGFDVVDFPRGVDLLEWIDEGGGADVIVLDWHMPRMSGIDVMRHLRQKNVSVPVVFLTGLSGESYEEAALDGGAVDFVDKSRSISILAKRLRIAIQLSQADPVAHGDVVECGHLTLKARTGQAYWRDREVDLTLSEFNVVQYLVRRVGNNVSYREVYDCVRGQGFIAGSGEEGYRTNVRSLIKRIRQKFRDVDGDFGEILNFPSFGYRWRNPED